MLAKWESGIRTAENLDPSIIATTVRGDVIDEEIPTRFLAGKTLRNTSRFARMGVEAAGEALIDAGLLDAESFEPTADLQAAGAVIGGTFWQRILKTRRGPGQPKRSQLRAIGLPAMRAPMALRSSTPSPGGKCSSDVLVSVSE